MDLKNHNIANISKTTDSRIKQMATLDLANKSYPGNVPTSK